MKRELGSFERALVIANQHAPFHMVSVLRLEGGPPPNILRQSLKVLQNHHPFLTGRLLRENGRYYIKSLEHPGIPLHILPRWNDDHWVQVAEVEMGTRMDISTGPLFRCTYLYNSTDGRADIIFAFFHSIIDAASAGQLMNELLITCASFMDEKTVTVFELPPAPPVESRFPSAFRGFGLTLHTLRYTLQQLADEIIYRIQTKGKQVPTLLKSPSRGHILSLQLPEELVDSLARRGLQENVNLTSIIYAALLISVNRNLYAGKQVLMRTISFADLRPYVVPPLSVENLACYISMLRYTVQVEGGADFWHLAHRLHGKTLASLKSGDTFVASVISEPLMKLLTRSRAFRMGATALNNNGIVPIQPGYGKIKVKDIHGYVSVYDLGPEFSAQAHVFNGNLCLDFMYLDADMSAVEAKAIVEEIKKIFQSVISGEVKQSSPV